MTKPTILEETPINLSELKESLTNIEKRDKELNFRSNKTKEYLDIFNLINRPKSKELEKKIRGFDIPRLKDVHIQKILDLMPTSVDDLKAVLQGYTITVKNENFKKIVDAVNEYNTPVKR